MTLGGWGAQVYTVATLDRRLVGRCMRLRNVWWTARNRRVGPASGQPNNDSRPPKRPYYLTSLLALAAKHGTQPAEGPAVALFVITRRQAESESVEDCEETEESSAETVVGFLLTERIGRTIVSVEGVHDYSTAKTDPRADPSAWLLHQAVKWWRSEGDVEPLWLNDGPVPTPGLLAYKHQYRGSTQALLSLRCGRASRAAAERVAQRQGESHSET